MTTFTAQTYYNEFLPLDATTVDAVVTVTASGAGAAPGVGGAPDSEEIVIVDVSGSMSGGRKLVHAKNAAAAAVDCIRDGVRFGIIGGCEEALPVYPAWGPLVEAGPTTRAEAKAAIAELTAGGGTAMGTWLLEAQQRFGDDPATIRHAILLTDGKNESETAEALDAALRACEGRFQCDCRGVGTEWQVAELRSIAERLLGTHDMVAKPQDLEADFRSMIDASMRKGTGDVRLRVWVPEGAAIDFVKEVHPRLVDLADQRSVVSELETDYATGAWGDESRDYHVRVSFPARAPGESLWLAARIKLMVGDEKVEQAGLPVTWTDDLVRSTRPVAELVKYQKEEESSRLAREGIEALKNGDLETATDLLPRAAALYAEAGNPAQAANIGRLLETAPDGTRRLRRDTSAEAVMEAEVRTGRTERLRPGEPRP